MANAPDDMEMDEEEVYFSFSESESDTEAGPFKPMLPADENPPVETDSGNNTPKEELPGPATMTARAYQREMFEESLKKNIIVTMDTGSGKTQVAILRIRGELERTEKRVWFLAPTVPLASQQHDVLRAQISGLQSRLICGADNVEAWSDQAIWDEILQNIRVVVSTYQILFDAVSHGFVRLSTLSLIVIDEAHNCVKNNAVARLMKELYWRDKKAGLPVPAILGLTASPLMRTNFDDLEVLEMTLDAVCKSPNRHRDELLAKVNRPNMHTIRYQAVNEAAPAGATSSMERLNRAYQALDIKQDPQVLRLLTENTAKSRAKLKEVIMKHDTYCRRQMRSFLNNARVMHNDLGPWAADYYIEKVITNLLEDHSTRDKELPGSLGDQERAYLTYIFRKVELPPLPTIPTNLSAKAQALITILDSHKEDSVGIVFVKERATTAVLTHLLSIHPVTKDRYRPGSMVGTSTAPGRKRDFLDLSQKEDLFSLQNFRVGKTNLLVATNVLEEGIDVPACNLVVCFDEPKTPKSFIQRRGRARMSASYLYLLIAEGSEKSAETWQKFENEMKELYETDMRDHKVIEELERRENAGYPVLEVKETGARLTIDDAKRHLEHFCATLTNKKFVDTSPYYTIQTLDGSVLDPAKPSLLQATVHLPISLAPELRCFKSIQAWYSQDFAYKDAAFQAYQRLYEIGLVNKHLLPAQESDLIPQVEPRTGLAMVSEQQNPWLNIAQEWRKADGKLFHRRLVVANEDGSMCAEVEVVLPVPIPHMETLKIYCAPDSLWTVTMDLSMQQSNNSVTSKHHTDVLLSMAFGHRNGWTNTEKQYPLRVISVGQDISVDDMGAIDFSPELMQGAASSHLIRDPSNKYHPYFYQCWLPSKPPVEMVGHLLRPSIQWSGFDYASAPENIPYVVVRSWPKKAGFFRKTAFHPDATISPANAKPYPRIQAAELVKVDRVPAVYSHIGILIPAISYALEVHLVAQDLMENVLEKIGIADLSLVVTAISTTSARGPTDYERIEFLGDTILKFCTIVNASARNLHWPEGYLSRYKDMIVANSRLFQAAVNSALDRYIISKQFSLNKPVYVEDLLEISPLEQMQKKRQLTTKTPADVIEALIGVSYLSGGLPKALKCVSHFLPEVNWDTDIDIGRQTLFDAAPSDEQLPVNMRRAEELIGYTFKKKSLLVEALTHPSYAVAGVNACFERLEFLGDSVLDFIVTTTLYNSPDLQNHEMHLLRTALVNGDILAFLVMEWAVEEDRIEVESTCDDEDNNYDETESRKKRRTGNNAGVRLKTTKVKHPLWSFMRHMSNDMGVCQSETKKRHAEMRDAIVQGLESGTHYPWSLLARLQAQKLYSDIFESVLGAVWTDSGDMDECFKVVERLGILQLMRRLLRDKVHVLHPKEELGRLAGNEKVQYGVRYVESAESESGKELLGWVVVGGRRLAEVKGGVSKEEAKTRAAEVACLVIKQERAKK